MNDMDNYFDMSLTNYLKQAFKECNLDYDTYNGFAAPPEVVKRLEEIYKGDKNV